MEHSDVTLVAVGSDQLPACGIGCVLDRRHVGFGPKTSWLAPRFEEGLRMLMVRDEAGKPLAFLEVVPGEHAWRPVRADGWHFVHCLWVYPRAKGRRGLGQLLLKASIERAEQSGARGVAAFASDGPWMAPPSAFLRAGFMSVDQRDRFQLVAYPLDDGDPPRFAELDPTWSQDQGLHVVYADQCPYLPKSVAAMEAVAQEFDLPLYVTRLRSAEEAKRAPSYYGVFSLLLDGKVLADHYVSATRFRNILKHARA